MELVAQLEVLPSYFEGFPMLAACVLHNPDPDGWYTDLPDVDRFGAPGPISLHVQSADGRSHTVAAERRERGALCLDPLARARFLVDLGQWCAWPCGDFSVRAQYRAGPLTIDADPVDVRVVPPSPSDAHIAAALRRLGGDDGSWDDFLLGNSHVPDAEALSSAAHRALTWHLFVHWAIHGPDAVGALALSRLDGIEGGVLDPEIAALRYEIGVASRAVGVVEARRRLLTRWPDLAWRLDEADQGLGFLENLRASYGVESSDPPTPSPYLP